MAEANRIPSAPGLFLREFFKSFRLTASVVPSTRYLTAALCEPVDFEKARIIAEFGPGTGPVTNGILNRMHPEAVLYAIDMNPVFIDHLKRACKDKRLRPILGSAADLHKIVDGASDSKVDAVISSLGLTSMDSPLRKSIYDQVKECLRPGGVLTQYQYATSKAGCKIARSDFDERRFLDSYFETVTTKWVLVNFPPACVFTCRKA